MSTTESFKEGPRHRDARGLRNVNEYAPALVKRAEGVYVIRGRCSAKALERFVFVMPEDRHESAACVMG